jgi:hypothetical protein
LKSQSRNGLLPLKQLSAECLSGKITLSLDTHISPFGGLGDPNQPPPVFADLFDGPLTAASDDATIVEV